MSNGWYSTGEVTLSMFKFDYGFEGFKQERITKSKTKK